MNSQHIAATVYSYNPAWGVLMRGTLLYPSKEYPILGVYTEEATSICFTTVEITCIKLCFGNFPF